MGEIQSLLAKSKANEIMIEYSNGQPVALMFSLSLGGGFLRYRLPCRWQAIQKVLKRDAKLSAHKTDSHALNVAWRVVKDWIEAQVALVETEMVEIQEVFLPYELTEGKQTIFEKIMERRMLVAKDD